MKKYLLFIFVLTASTLFAQSDTRNRSDETANPEIDNLSGLTPDPSDYNPNNSQAISPMENNETITDNAYGINPNSNKIISTEPISKLLSDITLNIYPNPASEYIIVELSDAVDGEVEILNLVGQAELRFTFSSTQNRLDISQLNQGVYFVSIRSGDEKIVRKIKVLD